MKHFNITLLLLYGLSWLTLAQQFNPIANKEATVVAGNARFTVLTPSVIRMEYAADSIFEDHSTLTIINRNLPVPAFVKSTKGGWLTIKTSELTLRYKASADTFDASNLLIDYTLEGKKKTWNLATTNIGNLSGTSRTLDAYKGNVHFMNNERDTLKLETGLVSRDGWVVVDDSRRPLFDNSDWQWVMARPVKKIQDFYFFQYGTNYKQVLYDFSKLAGHIALPPKFTMGIWWSRYWAYSDVEFKDLVSQFRLHDVPLDVLVIDMDWHKVNQQEFFDDNGDRLKDQAGEPFGWTGYSWNRSLFPDPKGFLKWTNDNHIQTCMNLHPASGIQPHEDFYPEMAKSMGIDPATKKYVPFDIVDKKFAQNYLNIMLHPMEKDGIDFWWLDWQQWGSTKIAGVNPTFYLNYVHTSDMERRGIRPLIFHRWGGLGNHRYQIGFSGDTKICWESLNYQPYFTATASNVLYGFWSHDIGGHMKPDGYDAELYTRWIQWGAFSPVLRTHCTSDPSIERKIWAYPEQNFNAMRDAMKLRFSLFPYNYTNARMAYDSAVSIMRPMYYDYPKSEQAYKMSNQYMFGPDMLVSPVTKAMQKDSLNGTAYHVSQEIWLPQGEWFEWNSGTLIQGNRLIQRPFMLNEIPIYVRSGAIVPMQPDMSRVGERAVDPLILNIFPGNQGSTRVYDDAGNDLGYKTNQYTFTNIAFQKHDTTLTAQIMPIEGQFKGMPQARSYELRLPLTFVPLAVKVNGQLQSFTSDTTAGWHYDGTNLCTIVKTPRFSVSEKVTVEITFPNLDVHQLSALKGKANKLYFATRQIIQGTPWNNKLFNFDAVTSAGQTLNRINTTPTNSAILAEKEQLNASSDTIINIFKQQNALYPHRYTNFINLLNAVQ